MAAGLGTLIERPRQQDDFLVDPLQVKADQFLGREPAKLGVFVTGTWCCLTAVRAMECDNDNLMSPDHSQFCVKKITH